MSTITDCLSINGTIMVKVSMCSIYAYKNPLLLKEHVGNPFFFFLRIVETATQCCLEERALS